MFDCCIYFAVSNTTACKDADIVNTQTCFRCSKKELVSLIEIIK